MTNPLSLHCFYYLQDIPLPVGSGQSCISRTISPSLSSTLFQNILGTPDYFPNCRIFNTTQSYAPKVTFLLAVSMNTPQSCHSKQQQFTAHKLHSSNSFFHNCSISHSVQPFHDTDGLTPSAPAMYHVTHCVQLAQSVKTFDFEWLQTRKKLNRNKTDFLTNRQLNSVNHRSDVPAAIHCDGYRLWCDVVHKCRHLPSLATKAATSTVGIEE